MAADGGGNIDEMKRGIALLSLPCLKRSCRGLGYDEMSWVRIYFSTRWGWSAISAFIKSSEVFRSPVNPWSIANFDARIAVCLLYRNLNLVAYRRGAALLDLIESSYSNDHTQPSFFPEPRPQE